MTTPINTPSSSSSRSFDQLATHVQRWVYDENWTGLRDAQEAAIPLLLDEKRDVLISAATAGGKTEAAFLPIVSKLLDSEPIGPGVQALYVAPLKALINDQYQRLLGMCEGTDLAVNRWHGDVAADKKHKVLKDPSGILLMTPESLEAMFVLRGTLLPGILGSVRYVIIDELHAFLGTERGAQLLSQLHRLELAARRRIVRVGLSATLGDMSLAAAQLRPASPGSVALIESKEGGQELRLAVRGYVQPARPSLSKNVPTLHLVGDQHVLEEDVEEEEDAAGMPAREIAAHLFSVCRGSDNLVFPGSRASVEMYADRLRRACEQANLPNEFFPHHGSLSKELREDVEAALKDPSKPTTAVATTTLEMGIDIGSVTSIAQVNAPTSVASLRQRLGRSGRRGEPAVLRAYVIEPALDALVPLDDQLRGSLVQTVVMMELLLEGWCEPPDQAVLHLSTLVQQLLSLIAQHGGVSAAQAHSALCSSDGPFAATDRARFAALLRALAAADAIEQDRDGTLLLGAVGEQAVNHYTFYAAFQTPEEYRLLTGGRQLGTLPVDFPLYESLLIVFGGKRWRVVSVDEQQRTVDLVRAQGGRAPAFAGGGMPVHDHVRARMRLLLAGDLVPPYLNEAGKQLLAQGRATFARENMDRYGLLGRGAGCVIAPWTGTVTTNTLAAQLKRHGIEVAIDELTMTCSRSSVSEVSEALGAIAEAGPADAVSLAATVRAKEGNKYDSWLSEDLLNEDFAARSFNTAGAHAAAGRLLAEGVAPDAVSAS
jgi:ATP-dependent Lhr-like helicase